MKRTFKKTIILMALLCFGMSVHAMAAEPLVYTGAETFVMPGAEGTVSQLGRAEGTANASKFENSYTAFGINIPEGCTLETFEKVLYDVDGSLKLYGYVPDMLLSTYAATAERPDPEMGDDDTMVMLCYFLGKTDAAGTPIDVGAYMQRVIGRLCQNDKLLPYIEVSERSLGRNNYLCQSLDYTKAIQSYYHSIYAGEAEHPAFDESFSYRAELYARDLGDKYYMIMYVKSGESFESAVDFTSYIY